MGSAPRFPISALTLVEKHIPYTVYSIPNFPQKQNPNSRKNHTQQTQILSTPYFAYLGFWQFLCITPFVHTREHYFFFAPW